MNSCIWIFWNTSEVEGEVEVEVENSNLQQHCYENLKSWYMYMHYAYIMETGDM